MSHTDRISQTISAFKSAMDTMIASLEPPAVITRTEAVSRLRASVAPAVYAIGAMTPERAGGHCVQFPFGEISLHQCAEFAGAHVTRHQGQMQRALTSV